MPHRQIPEHLLATLLESPEDAILSVSLDGNIDTWSQGAKNIYGYTAQEMTGQPMSRLVPLHEWPGLKSIFSSAGSNGTVSTETTQRLHKDGSRKLLMVKRIFICDELGNVTGFSNARGRSILAESIRWPKRINDLHGHLAGNHALQRLAAVLNEHCRSTDLAVRYGGDEFALVMIDSDKDMAEQVAHHIENGLQFDQGKPPMSVSIGISIYPEDGRTVAELIESADQQLYKYKRTENRRTAPALARGLSTKRAAR